MSLKVFCVEWKMHVFTAYFGVKGAVDFSLNMYPALGDGLCNNATVSKICDLIMSMSLNTATPPNSGVVCLIRLLVGSSMRPYWQETTFSRNKKNSFKTGILEEFGITYHLGKKKTVQQRKESGRGNGRDVANPRDSKVQQHVVWNGVAIWAGADKKDLAVIADAVMNYNNPGIALDILENTAHEGYHIAIGDEIVFDAPGLDTAGRLFLGLYERAQFSGFTDFLSFYATEIKRTVRLGGLWQWKSTVRIPRAQNADTILQDERYFVNMVDYDRNERLRDLFKEPHSRTRDTKVRVVSVLILLEVCV